MILPKVSDSVGCAVGYDLETASTLGWLGNIVSLSHGLRQFQASLLLVAAITAGVSLSGCAELKDGNSASTSGGHTVAQLGTSASVSSSSIAEDGRMLRPAGFEGIWFETEPTEAWEHAVWESQKFVGEDFHLRRISSGGVAHPNFYGLPDICDPAVQKRAAGLGFSFQEGAENDDINYECGFVRPVEGVRHYISLVVVMGTVPDSGYEEIPDMPLRAKAMGRSSAFEMRSKNPVFDCAAGEGWRSGRYVVAVYDSLRLADMADDRELRCYTNQLVRQFVANLGVGYDPM